MLVYSGGLRGSAFMGGSTWGVGVYQGTGYVAEAGVHSYDGWADLVLVYVQGSVRCSGDVWVGGYDSVAESSV